jgi:subtilase family serine protease
VEALEDRLLLNGTPPIFRPPYELYSPNGSPNPPTGALTPAQVRHAYCIDQIKFGSVVGDGSGQTIAIVDAYDNPKLVSSTSAGFVNSDLHKFDVQFGLPDPPSFKKLDQNGGTNYPPTDPAGAGNFNWEAEEALDVEWAHAIAPKANIILIEANDATDANLITAAVGLARQLPGVVVVSMSFGGAEFSGEAALDSVFTTPTSHKGVTFLASTGDNGSPGEYPAYSPNVVAVGGTTLTISGAAGNYVGETGWSGSGGGISQFENQPGYQKGVVTQSTSKRTIPDVSFDADPNTGVAVYDSYNDVNNTGAWEQVGGTSLACPCWAGLIAIADQGRAVYGRSSLDGPSQTLPTLYNIAKNPSQYKLDFHDIVSGSNGGFNAGPGYDLVTGIGSPVACQLVPFLAGPASSPPPPGQSPQAAVYWPLRYVYNPATQTHSGDLTLTNVGGGLLTGPATFTFPKLPSGVRLVNATGYTASGAPFIKVSFPPLAHGQSVRVQLVFTDPLGIPLSTFLQGLPIVLTLG